MQISNVCENLICLKFIFKKSKTLKKFKWLQRDLNPQPLVRKNTQPFGETDQKVCEALKKFVKTF